MDGQGVDERLMHTCSNIKRHTYGWAGRKGGEVTVVVGTPCEAVSSPPQTSGHKW